MWCSIYSMRGVVSGDVVVLSYCVDKVCMPYFALIMHAEPPLHTATMYLPLGRCNVTSSSNFESLTLQSIVTKSIAN